jgi:hypothetical protein
LVKHDREAVDELFRGRSDCDLESVGAQVAERADFAWGSVAAVIAVVSLINGTNQYVATRVFRLDADVFGVSKRPSIITNVDDWLEFQKRKRLDSEDYDAIKELCKSCRGIGASLGDCAYAG